MICNGYKGATRMCYPSWTILSCCAYFIESNFILGEKNVNMVDMYSMPFYYGKMKYVTISSNGK